MVDNQIKLAAEEAHISDKIARILCVDDEVFNLDILEKHLKKAGYLTVTAENGEAALELLEESKTAPIDQKIDVVLLDRMMPGMEGIEVLKKMKEDAALQDIPVIMQTAMASSDDAIEGIEAGAYYYVTKPYDASVLLSIVASAVREHEQSVDLRDRVRKRDIVLSLTKNAEFEVRTLPEAREVAAHLSNLSQDPSRVIMGLTALIVNAVEHGNLEIGCERKHELLVLGEWEQEVDKRLVMPEYAGKRVRVSFVHHNDGSVVIEIEDQGQGFNWSEYMDFEPMRMTEPNGRGIAIANIMSPGNVEYHGNGNKVTYTIPPGV